VFLCQRNKRIFVFRYETEISLSFLLAFIYLLFGDLMNKLLSTLVAGVFAAVSFSAVAVESAPAKTTAVAVVAAPAAKAEAKADQPAHAKHKHGKHHRHHKAS
jgi:hypothetical protein